MSVFVIGDSISIQYGPYLEQALKGVMPYARKEGTEEALKDLDIPQGANGGDSGMVLAYLRTRAGLGGISAKYLLVNCGLHDIKTDPATGAKQMEPDAYRRNLEEIVRTVPDMGPLFVWIRTTPCDENVHNARPDMAFHRFAADNETYNRIADEVMAAAGVPVIDLHTFTANLDPAPYCDHVHFKEDIRRSQGAYIAGWITAFARK